jgi:hypothetical protein
MMPHIAHSATSKLAKRTTEEITAILNHIKDYSEQVTAANALARKDAHSPKSSDLQRKKH